MARLEGMYQIKDYVNRSEATVLSYIRTMEFPAVKRGKIWTSDTDMIDQWYLDPIKAINDNGTQEPAEPAPLKIKKKAKNVKLKKRKDC